MTLAIQSVEETAAALAAAIGQDRFALRAGNPSAHWFSTTRPGR
ncbi:MAG: hypothetical protein ACRDRJ_15195 [Streptosporangiaceae bacterium]